MRVALRLLSLLLVAILIAGCSKSNAADGVSNQLPDSAIKIWNMPPDGTRIPAPRALAVADREVYALDTAGRILVFGPDGKLKRSWWMPDYSVGRPEGICLMKDGRIAIADTHYHRVVLFDREGKVLGMFGSEGTGPSQFIYPVDLVQDNKQNLYVCEYGGNDRIQKFAPDGTFITAFGSFGTDPGQFQRPSGMVWREGKLYITDAVNNRVQIFQDDGKFLGVLGGEQPPELLFPYDIAFSDKIFYIVEYNGARVTQLSIDGKVLARYGSVGTGIGQFFTPWGMTVDEQKHILVADTGNRRIVELTP